MKTLISASILLLSAFSVNAAQFTFNFAGTIDSTENDIPGVTSIGVGSTFSYQVTVDTTDLFESSAVGVLPRRAKYQAQGSLSINGIIIHTTPTLQLFDVDIDSSDPINQFLFDSISIHAGNTTEITSLVSPGLYTSPEAVDGYDILGIGINLRDSSKTALSGNRLFDVAGTSIADYGLAIFELTLLNEDFAGQSITSIPATSMMNIDGHISSFTVTASPVPIPAAGWLFISAIAGLVGRRKFAAQK